MRRTANTSKILIGHVIDLMEILRTDEVLVRHDTLDSCEDELITQARLKLLQMALEIRRRGDEDKCVVLLDNTVQVTVKVDLVCIEVYAGEIGRVVAKATEILDTVIAPHIPADVVSVSHHDLGYRRCPATATDNCYPTTVVHISGTD